MQDEDVTSGGIQLLLLLFSKVVPAMSLSKALSGLAGSWHFDSCHIEGCRDKDSSAVSTGRKPP